MRQAEFRFCKRPGRFSHLFADLGLQLAKIQQRFGDVLRVAGVKQETAYALLHQPRVLEDPSGQYGATTCQALSVCIRQPLSRAGV